MKKKMIAISALFLFAVAFLFNFSQRRNCNSKDFMTKSFQLQLAFGDPEKTYGKVACDVEEGICRLCDGGFSTNYNDFGPWIECASGDIVK